MKPQDIYNIIYKMLDRHTPLRADCGQLCNRACCKGDENTGMYLFPFEEVMFRNKKDWFKIISRNNKKLFICNGTCERNFRPLSCRLFPLVPYISENGGFSVVMDPRAKKICLLAYAVEVKDLDPEFVKRVAGISKLLIKFETIKKFIYDISRECDEWQLPFL